MKPIHLGALTLLGAIWGMSFIFIGVAVQDFGPLLMMELRVAIAVIILLIYTALFSRVPNVLSRWRDYLIAGTLNAALPFVLIAFAQLTLTASLAAILNSTTPLFTAIIAGIFTKEKLTPQKIVGAAMGIIGVGVLVGGSPLDLNGAFFLAVGASLGAAFLYGVGTVFVAEKFRGTKPMTNAIGQLLGASVALLIPAGFDIPSAMPSPLAIAALLALAALSTSFAYMLYFYLINTVGATRTATVTFLVPVFGSMWGILLLQDPFTVQMVVGMVIILLSVSLVLGLLKRSQKAQSVG